MMLDLERPVQHADLADLGGTDVDFADGLRLAHQAMAAGSAYKLSSPKSS